MNSYLSYLNSIPGINAELLSNDPNKFKVKVDEGAYDYSKKEVIYQQQEKEISFKERFRLGRLLGYGRVHSLWSACFTAFFNSQALVSKYYLTKLKNITPLQIGDDILKFGGSGKQPKERRLEINRRWFRAHFNTELSANGIGTPYNDILRKVGKDLNSVDYKPLEQKLHLIEDRHKLQEIGSYMIRGAPYQLFISKVGTEAIVSKELLELPNDPVIQKIENVKSEIFAILGFKVSSK